MSDQQTFYKYFLQSQASPSSLRMLIILLFLLQKYGVLKKGTIPTIGYLDFKNKNI